MSAFKQHWVNNESRHNPMAQRYQLIRRQIAGFLLIVLSMSSAKAVAQIAEANYDEAKVPKYQLPDPLLTESGVRVATAESWHAVRRPELLSLFEREVYGTSPRFTGQLQARTLVPDETVLDGAAVRRQMRIHYADVDDAHFDLLIYLPTQAEKPSPAFLALNFWGNHSIADDPDIVLSKRWMRKDDGGGIVDHRATEATRGRSASRWPVRTIVERGYALGTMYCGDIDPDYHDGFSDGVHGALNRVDEPRAPDAWGTISAWAWGLSRALDYLESDANVDADRVAVLGHSRLGKTSLWAGATDQRFAMVISNNSGCGGAALSRRAFGETVARINDSFPHWFCENFRKYGGNESASPVDQHQLIALIAPRPVYVASAEEDRWADPRGEFLSALHASPVYQLLGVEGLPVPNQPPLDQPVTGTIGYHIRTGKHDVTDFDWSQYLDFADRHLSRKLN